MNEHVLDTLEYDKIRNRIQNFAVTENGKKLVDKLHPSSNIDVVQHMLDETADGADILRLKGGIALASLADIRKHLKRLKIGASLNGKELAEITNTLKSVKAIASFFRDLANDDVELRNLYDLVEKLELLPEITRRLSVSVESDGYITNDASPALKSIRNQIENLENSVRTRLAEMTRGNSSKYLTNTNVTIRNERYVIPVKAEYKGQFGGVVHDQSASGQTLFIEPREIVDLNNRLRQAQSAEKEEINRILRELSELIAPYTNELEHDAWIMGKLDFVNAKARYAKEINGALPIVSDKNDIYLRQAWHPLLNPQTVVKNDITIGKDYKAIVITGPNTGGKTITLKTLGLIQLMGQSGLFIPTNEESRIGVFDEIFADIGDEQSIEQSLSTFSSHMTYIVDILSKTDEKSLALFDEIGAGTDPQEGAALAIAILDAIGTKGSYVVATTHYPELKAYGFDRPDTINASVEFDAKTFRPTYRLLIGIPGRSNAFDISQRLGLDPLIVNAARELTTSDSQDLNEMIADLVQKRHDAEEEKIAFDKYLADSEKLHDDLEREYSRYLKQKDNMLEQAKQQANDIVREAQKKAEDIISELRQMRLEKRSDVKEDELISQKTKLNQLEQPIHLQKNRILRRAKKQQTLQVNDDVLVKSYGQQGVLVRQIDKDNWEVQLGILRMKIPAADLEKIKVNDNNEPKSAHISVKRTSSSGVSPTLDLRGSRFDEAMNKVDRYIDEAILAGYPSVTIIHGKGTGALRNGITQYLQSNSSVKKFHYATPNNGGNGATVVEFK